MSTQPYYVIPDIHGRNDLLCLALDHIYNTHPGGGKIIFLGDYIDRGKQNAEALLTVMNPPDKWEFITLKGNHETMLVGGFNRDHEYYDSDAVIEIKDHPLLSLPMVVNWINSLPFFHFEGDNIFAHADYAADIPPEDQREQECVWNRYDDHTGFISEGNKYYLTHGHTPRKHGPLTAMNRLNLDCGAVFYGRLVVAEFHANKRGPQNFHVFTLEGST